mgnify:CR=1 FL=1
MTVATLERLFGEDPDAKKKKAAAGKGKAKAREKVTTVSLLDSGRAQNLGIALARFRVAPRAVRSLVLRCDDAARLTGLDLLRDAVASQLEAVLAFKGAFHANGADKELYMVFIRAPRIVELGDGVEALATCRDDCVMARQGNIVVASFHPELTDDLTVHSYFLECLNHKSLLHRHSL